MKLTALAPSAAKLGAVLACRTISHKPLGKAIRMRASPGGPQLLSPTGDANPSQDHRQCAGMGLVYLAFEAGAGSSAVTARGGMGMAQSEDKEFLF